QRILVCDNQKKKPAGVISLQDLARAEDEREIGETVQRVKEAGQPSTSPFFLPIRSCCGSVRGMRIAAALLLVCAAARAEEIRIEVSRGRRAARIESGGHTHAVSVRGSTLSVGGKPAESAEFAGPLRLDGRELPGRLELFADRGVLVAVNAVDLEQYVAAVGAGEVPAGGPPEAVPAPPAA